MKNIFSSLFLTAALCFNSHYSAYKAQNTGDPAFGVESFSSGNTHGTFFRPYAGIAWGRNFVSAGPMIQKRSNLLKGVKVEYSRNLSGCSPDTEGAAPKCEPIQLNFISYIQYNKHLPMSYYVVQEQQNTSRRADADWNSVLLSTAETGFGMEVRIRITQNITWRNSSTASFHYHLNYVKGLTRERFSPSLGLCTGLLFTIR